MTFSENGLAGGVWGAPPVGGLEMVNSARAHMGGGGKNYQIIVYLGAPPGDPLLAPQTDCSISKLRPYHGYSGRVSRPQKKKTR